MRVFDKFLQIGAMIGLLAACATSTSQIDIDNIHFPRFASNEDREVVPGYLIGRLKLKENCIVVEATNTPLKGRHRTIMPIWDFDTVLSLDKGKIRITHPGFPDRKPLFVGSKVNLYGSGKGAAYDPTLLKLRTSPVPTCQPISNFFEVANW